MDWRPLLVEIIRRLWDRGLYWNNPWLKQIHDNYFDLWTSWRAAKTMDAIDMPEVPDPEIPDPIYWEETEGETPLGGPMGFSYEFETDDNS